MMSPHTAFPSGQLLQVRAASVMPGGVNSATRYIGAPYAFTRSAGQYVWDADGNRYTDYHAAFGAILLGHNDPHVNEAVREALGELDQAGRDADGHHPLGRAGGAVHKRERGSRPVRAPGSRSDRPPPRDQGAGRV